MAKVIPLNNVTRLDIPPERVLSVIPDLKSFVIMGYTKDGEEWFASSIADGADVLWMLERMKLKLLNVEVPA